MRRAIIGGLLTVACAMPLLMFLRRQEADVDPVSGYPRRPGEVAHKPLAEGGPWIVVDAQVPEEMLARNGRRVRLKLVWRFCPDAPKLESRLRFNFPAAAFPVVLTWQDGRGHVLAGDDGRVLWEGEYPPSDDAP